jgi:hypothetical protein
VLHVCCTVQQGRDLGNVILQTKKKQKKFRMKSQTHITLNIIRLRHHFSEWSQDLKQASQI